MKYLITSIVILGIFTQSNLALADNKWDLNEAQRKQFTRLKLSLELEGITVVRKACTDN